MSAAEKLSNCIESGNIYINCYNIPKPCMPFGGYTYSGFGRSNSDQGFQEFI